MRLSVLNRKGSDKSAEPVPVDRRNADHDERQRMRKQEMGGDMNPNKASASRTKWRRILPWVGGYSGLMMLSVAAWIGGGGFPSFLTVQGTGIIMISLIWGVTSAVDDNNWC